MKKHLSVLMLMARSSVYGLLGIIVATAAAEGALFYVGLNKAMANAASGFEPATLEVLFSGGVVWVFGAGFLFLMALLCSVGCRFGSRQDYTLSRLSVTEENVFLWQAIYNCLCLLIFWTAQLLISLALCQLFKAKVGPEGYSGQSVFLAFYRSRFLHSLLPLEETSRYIRNIVLLIALGVSAAAFSYRQRHEKRSWAAAVLSAVCLVAFSGKTGELEGDVFIILLSAALAIGSAWRVLWREREYEK